MTYVSDNHDSADHFYMVAVLTSMLKDSGTTARVSIRITGDEGSSATHMLHDNNVKLFRTGAEDWFVVAEDTSLGKLNDLTVWVDYSNTTPAW